MLPKEQKKKVKKFNNKKKIKEKLNTQELFNEYWKENDKN